VSILAHIKKWGRRLRRRSRSFVGADRESWVATALTRASRRLQKHATAAPLALSLDRERDLEGEGILISIFWEFLNSLLENRAGAGSGEAPLRLIHDVVGQRPLQSSSNIVAQVAEVPCAHDCRIQVWAGKGEAQGEL
jgi:hypothetical protein